MNTSTENEIEGDLHEVKGTIKEKVGQVTDNPKLTAEGQAEKLAGKDQEKAAEIVAVLEE